MIDQRNKQFHEIEIEKRPQNLNHPYYQGSIHIKNSPSNRLNENQPRKNQNKSIRLFSAKMSNQKNKKYISQEKLKIYKDMSISHNKPYSGKNYQTLQNRPTSVRQNHQKIIFFPKRKGGGGNGYNSEINYPQITINSAISQTNNVPLQRRRKILYEEDNELAEQYEKLRTIWKEAGVTDVYIDNFETVTNNQNNTREEILQSLKNEQLQMIKFKEDVLKLVSEIMKRENDIKTIIELNKRYLNVKTNMNIFPKRNIKNNNYFKEKEEINNENNEDLSKEIENEKRKELEEEKNKIEEEIERCLHYLRLHGINVVAAIRKFNMKYENLLNAGKVDLDFLKKTYGYDNNYLMKLKTDLDFLKNTDIGDLYHFSQKGKDPFLISISIEVPVDKNDKTYEKYKFKILPISEDMAKLIKLYNHLLNEVEIFTLMKNNNYSASNTYTNNISHAYKYGGLFNGVSKNNNINTSLSLEFNPKYKTINNISSNKITFNSIQNKIKLQNQKYNSLKLLNEDKKSQNQNEVEKLKKNLEGPYVSQVDNDDDTSNDNNDKFYNNNYNYNNQHNNRYVNKNLQMPKIKSYGSNSMVEEESSQTSKVPDDDIVKEVETRVNKEVINKLYEVENRVKKQVEEKLKKDKERLEEEEKKLRKEKEKIEELRKIEEEKRQKDREKWEKIENDRKKREEEERQKYEEDERIRKIEKEQFRKDIEEKFLNEIEQRFIREENERKRREEENNLIKRELELKLKII